MNEDLRKSTEGVIAGMLRSLEGTQQEDETSVVLEHERVPVPSEKTIRMMFWKLQVTSIMMDIR